MADLESGRTEGVLPGILMSEFDIARDGEHVAFASRNAEGSSRVWMASLDHRTPPRQLTTFEAEMPSFGVESDLFFRGREGGSDFIYGMGRNDNQPRKLSPNPAPDFTVVSPDGEWWLSSVPQTMARPTRGGSSVRVCDLCDVGWGSGDKYFYIRLREVGAKAGGKAFAIALPSGKSLPALPASGIKSAEDLKGLQVVAAIDMTGMSLFAPGPNPSTYAYGRMTVQRNLFRIPLD